MDVQRRGLARLYFADACDDLHVRPRKVSAFQLFAKWRVLRVGRRGQHHSQEQAKKYPHNNSPSRKLAFCAAVKRPTTQYCILVFENNRSGPDTPPLVAGEGLEPPTPGL